MIQVKKVRLNLCPLIFFYKSDRHLQSKKLRCRRDLVVEGGVVFIFYLRSANSRSSRKKWPLLLGIEKKKVRIVFSFSQSKVKKKILISASFSLLQLVRGWNVPPVHPLEYFKHSRLSEQQIYQPVDGFVLFSCSNQRSSFTYKRGFSEVTPHCFDFK